MMIAFEQPCECMIMRLGGQARECQQAHTSNYGTNTRIRILFADSIRLGGTVPGGAQGAAICITYVGLIPRVVCTHALEQKVLKVHQKRPLIGHPSHSVFGNDPAPFTCRAGSCRVKWEEASGGQKAATIGCLGTLLVLFVVVLFTCTGGSSGTSNRSESESVPCISGWSGQHLAFTRAVKRQLVAPDSFKHVESVEDGQVRPAIVVSGRSCYDGADAEAHQWTVRRRRTSTT